VADGPDSRAALVEFLATLGVGVDRRVELKRILSVWAEDGHVASDAAVRFVGLFDGITFEYPRHPLTGGTYECVLDAVRATRATYSTRVREYERRTGQSLAPVGLAESNHVTLMIAPDGGVLGGYDDFLALYGENGEVALWNIYHRVLPVRLPMA